MAAMVQRVRASLISTPTASLINLVGVSIVVVALVATVQRVATAPGGATYFFQTMGFGLALGAIFALVALGYTMVYGIIELINFAHGDVFTLGAFISAALLPFFGLTEGRIFGIGVVLPLIGVFLVTMLVCALINVGIERVAYRPLRHAPRLAPLITAIGMSALLEGLMIALTVFVNRSTLGKAMRATAQDRDAAQLMGIDINRTISATFFIGAALAGAGGIIYGLYYNSYSAFDGFTYGLYAFTAAVFGGIGNIPGAALGGLLIGVIYAISDGYFTVAWTQVLVFAILIFVLVFRPTGLLGMRVPEK